MKAKAIDSMTSDSRNAYWDVERVLKQLAQGNPAAPWKIRLIGQGYQAQLFLAQRRLASACQSVENEVVVKLYRVTVPADRQACLSEKSGLETLSELLPGNVGDGWSICSPALLCASDQPLALVMSSLSGVSLDVWLHSHAPTAAETVSIVEAVLASLQVLWAQGFMYGDLNLKNILYDVKQRKLGFIDPGLPAEYYRCEHVPQEWFPMSRDLAYLLFSVAVSIRSTLGNPASRQRQQRFVSLLVRKYVEAIGSSQQQASLLDEVRLCIETHLDELNGAWSPAGIWRHFVKRITHRSLHRTLGQLVAQVHEVRT
ncbi:MAG: protein kinase [Planctomycetales bacterium]|nr:protein kinase [Planctomycetales bacterium]